MNAAPSPLLFDRALVRRHLSRARPLFAQHSALFTDIGEQIVERLDEVKQDFALGIDLSPFPFLPSGGKCARVYSTTDIVVDEELLPLAPQSVDLVVSNLGLHWVNDVPGALAQIRTALKPEGLFIAALIGGDSLHELRRCLIDAEIAVMGGISPRLSPMIDLPTASVLLHRAGYSLPVVDREIVTLLYPDMFALMRDLRGMGQSNANVHRLRHGTRREVFRIANALYHEHFGDAEGRIAASFEVIFLHGWK